MRTLLAALLLCILTLTGAHAASQYAGYATSACSPNCLGASVEYIEPAVGYQSGYSLDQGGPIWVGQGGNITTGYCNGYTLGQFGTRPFVTSSSGSVSDEAWTELFGNVNTSPCGAETPVGSFTPAPGDHIYLQIECSCSRGTSPGTLQTWNVEIEDITQGQTYTHAYSWPLCMCEWEIDWELQGAMPSLGTPFRFANFRVDIGDGNGLQPVTLVAGTSGAMHTGSGTTTQVASASVPIGKTLSDWFVCVTNMPSGVTIAPCGGGPYQSPAGYGP